MDLEHPVWAGFRERPLRVVGGAEVPADGGPSTLEALLARSERGIVLGCVSNLVLILRRDPALAGLLGFNEFVAAPVLLRAAPSLEDGAPGLPGPFPRLWQPADIVYVQTYVQRAWTKAAHRGDVEDAMLAVAAEHRFHPVRDWLTALVWDGVPRLDRWLAEVFGVPRDAYHRAVGVVLLIAAVRRVRRPGEKFDCMVIFEGVQGIGKSTAMRLLFGPDLFTDSLASDLGSRDAAAALQGVWCVEFAEIEQMIRTEPEVVKAFLSRSVDRFRGFYGRTVDTHPRQGVVVGTTNATDYLRDASGNRRFLPVRCEFADLALLGEWREQLWAEAAAREAQGEAITLGDDETGAAVAHQAARMQDDVWEDAISRALEGRSTMTIAELLGDVLKIPVERQDRSAQMRASAVLRRHGWQREVAWRDGRTIRHWRAP